MLITLSGLPGSGTSTVARAVASRLALDHVDGGTVFRSMASERGLSLAEFADGLLLRARPHRQHREVLRVGEVERFEQWLVCPGHGPRRSVEREAQLVVEFELGVFRHIDMVAEIER